MESKGSSTTNATRSSLLPYRPGGAVDRPRSENLTPQRKPCLRQRSPSKLPLGGLGRAGSTRQTIPEFRGPQRTRQSGPQSSVTPAKPAPTSTSRQAQNVPERRGDSSQIPTGYPKATTADRAVYQAHQLRSLNTSQNASRRTTPVLHLSRDRGLSDAPRTTSSPPTPPRSHNRYSSSSSILTLSPATKTLANAAAKIRRPEGSYPYSPPKTQCHEPSGQVSNPYAVLSSPAPQESRELHEHKLELLHLHSLHRNSGNVKKQWEESAQANFEKAFDRLRTLENDLKTEEIDHLEQINASALITWCREASVSGASKTEVLTGITDDIWTMNSSAGRYKVAIEAFEEWHEHVEHVREGRGYSTEDAELTSANMIEGLGDGWRQEVLSLACHLQKYTKDLNSLGEVDRPSDLARTITVLTTMLCQMEEELYTIQAIEADCAE